jgi:hypothetical protein
MAIAENGIAITENGHPDHLMGRPLRGAENVPF